MIDNFTTIDEYIDGFDGEKREILKELRKLIQKIAPEATETINYKMPTFRLNGNLIHFAMFKNHLGVYPGAETIEHFKADLTNYKTSKGAIQIQLNQSLPNDLIQQIIVYRIGQLKDQKTGEWTKYNGNWV